VEGDADQAQRGRGQEGCEAALQRPCGKQQALSRGQPPEGTRPGEAQQADDEHTFAADIVGHTAAEEQQATESQRVGGDYPVLVSVGDVKGALGGRERQIHDGRVKNDHQLGKGDDRQGVPAPRIGHGCPKI
jgi:hypothetical protein